MGKIVGVSDFYSNFRAFKKEVTEKFDLEGGETFGGEKLVIAKRNGFKIGELTCKAPPRQSNPRKGGNIGLTGEYLSLLGSVFFFTCFDVFPIENSK